LKRFGGFVFLVGAVFLLLTARRSMTADQKETSVLIRRMADAQQREGEIFRLNSVSVHFPKPVLSAIGPFATRSLRG
jgi:hypothetical protein